MLAVEWSNAGYAGAFVFGLLAGIVVVIRLAKVLTETFRELGERLRRPGDGDGDDG